MRIIHFEDSIDKHMDICSELRKCGETNVTWVTNLEDGLQMVRDAISTQTPFDLAITDMSYPLKSGLREDGEAGKTLLAELKNSGLKLPVIICSSFNYRIPGALGSIWYSDLSDWEWELRDLIKQRRKELGA